MQQDSARRLIAGRYLGVRRYLGVPAPAGPSVATTFMPDHDLASALFAERHVTTDSASIVAPIGAVTKAPIVIVPLIIATFTLAVGSDTEVELSKRDFGFGSDRIPPVFGGCRETPHCASDGGDEWQFSHS